MAERQLEIVCLGRKKTLTELSGRDFPLIHAVIAPSYGLSFTIDTLIHPFHFKIMFSRKNTLAQIDPELYAAIADENQRQEDHIELIASENYVSCAVMEAQGSQLTNKYAEGYPGKRYYGGCEHVDVAEQLAIDRLKALFGAEAANVQPNSGSQANQAVLMAFAKPGDTIMGMSLAEGGHLTHGMALNMSGKWFNVVAYGLNEKEEIDYAEMERLARQHKPRIIIAGASAYSLHIDFERFAKIAKEVGAIFWVDMAHYAGLIAAGYYPSPVPHADVVTSTTHKTLRGPRGGVILMRAEHEKAINSAIFPGLQGGPLMHVIAAKAVAFKEAATPEFRRYQEQVVANARVMAGVLAQRGLRIVSGRTQSHVFLVDLRAKNITGKEAERILGSAHITVNKNAIPKDPEKPFVTSGIRIGSPAMTTRGFTEIEAEKIANLIADVLDAPQDAAVIERVRGEVSALCRHFPVYGS
jgi:glycine hydroxymethyltransferase